jgi:hypothetical protein
VGSYLFVSGYLTGFAASSNLYPDAQQDGYEIDGGEIKNGNKKSLRTHVEHSHVFAKTQPPPMCILHPAGARKVKGKKRPGSSIL